MSDSIALENDSKYYSGEAGTLSLMYHRFNENKYPSTNVRMEIFEKQIQIIKNKKYKFENPDDFQKNFEKPKAEKKILITIDDAFSSFYENAWPFLKRNKIPFILFVSTEPVGKKVVIIGAGGIGFDVAELISHGSKRPSINIDDFASQWGIDFKNHPRGGVTGATGVFEKSEREIWMLQRKVTPVGIGLGRTTGWTHRISLKKKGITMLKGVEYKNINQDGISISVDNKPTFIEADTIIVCAGQEPDRSLYESAKNEFNKHLIGGAYEAREIDAKIAIKQASELAAII